MSWRIISVILLILAISISPRISIGALETGRNIDLRYEDFILVFIIILWFIRLSVQSKKEIYITPLFKPILIYIILATFSTCLGIIASWIVPAMAFFFFLKEIEYFLIFFIIANLIETYDKLKIAIYSLIICAMVNGIYAFYQVLSGKFEGNYGIGSTGETSSFPAGGYFAITFLLSMAIFFITKERLLKLISLASAALCSIGLLGSGSRANVIGVVFSSFVLLLFVARELVKTKDVRFVYYTMVIGILVLILLNPIILKLPTIERITNTKAMKSSFFEDRFGAYVTIFSKTQKNPIFGLGKTASTTVFIHGTGEAHNYYLRIFSEMGIFGLASFLYIILSIIKMSLNLYNNSQSGLGKAIGLGCLLATLNLMVASIAQDAFLTVKVNETFWVVVGLTASAYSIELKRQPDKSLSNAMKKHK